MNGDSLTNETTLGPEAEGLSELAPGEEIDRYRVLRLLGRGGMGQVYEVLHVNLGKRFALKILPSALARQPGFVSRFQREAKVMAKLLHPGIVRVHDLASTDGLYWLCMDVVQGVAADDTADVRHVTLADLVSSRGGKLDQCMLAALLSQLLEALSFAHRQGVIHRDLKPSNILLQGTMDDPIAMIADFGLVQLVGERWRKSQGHSPGLSSLGAAATQTSPNSDQSRALLGTYDYMSPEQKRGEPLDERSDLYSLGLMAFRLLTGHRDPGLSLPSEMDPSVCPAWDRLLKRALSPSPGGRFPHARQMLDQLGGFARNLAAPDAQPLAPPPDGAATVERGPKRGEPRAPVPDTGHLGFVADNSSVSIGQQIIASTLTVHQGLDDSERLAQLLDSARDALVRGTPSLPAIHKALELAPESPCGNLLLGLAILTAEPITRLSHRKAAQAEQALLIALDSETTVAAAAPALAALRHCYYADHSMKQPPPTFEDIKVLARSAGCPSQPLQAILDQMRTCDGYLFDWAI